MTLMMPLKLMLRCSSQMADWSLFKDSSVDLFRKNIPKSDRKCRSFEMTARMNSEASSNIGRLHGT